MDLTFVAFCLLLTEIQFPPHSWSPRGSLPIDTCHLNFFKLEFRILVTFATWWFIECSCGCWKKLTPLPPSFSSVDLLLRPKPLITPPARQRSQGRRWGRERNQSLVQENGNDFMFVRWASRECARIEMSLQADGIKMYLPSFNLKCSVTNEEAVIFTVTDKELTQTHRLENTFYMNIYCRDIKKKNRNKMFLWKYILSNLSSKWVYSI